MARKLVDRDSYDMIREHGVDLGNRILYVHDEYGGDGSIYAKLLLHVLHGLKALSSVSLEPITISLSTGGGEVSEGLSIYNAIRSFKPHVTIVTQASVQSMGAILLQAGDHRIVSPDSFVMFHEGDQAYSGHIKVIKSGQRIDKILNNRCDEILLDAINTKRVVDGKKPMTRKQLSRYNEFDTILTAAEAVDWGLADEVGS